MNITLFDLSILDFIQNSIKNGFLDSVMPFITHLGDMGILWIILTVLLILIPKTQKTGLTLAVSLILEALCCNIILKPLVSRIRPFDINTSVPILIKRPSDFSFPSGHTGAAFAAVSALYLSKSPLWLPSFILSVLIGFSRLYLYVHYPSDVLAGAALGIISGIIADPIIKAFSKEKKK